MKIPKAIQNLIEAFERLPGIGPKTAARLTFYLLRVPDNERRLLGQAVLELGEKTQLCRRCFNISDPTTQAGKDGLCDVCSDEGRDQSTICVVEEPLDLLSFERMGKYPGLYHVLHGVIAPLEHVGPENLKIAELMGRLKQEKEVAEVILATNPSLEGEATAMYIKKVIGEQLTDNSKQLKITRIASGIPTGGDLEYADSRTLSKAMEGRQGY
ncbi:MAG: recombination mediator RecR [Patescibacteria group bacterium]|nr:MAG: recombination mediator RecR [Patescibacteria group bacterium]